MSKTIANLSLSNYIYFQLYTVDTRLIVCVFFSWCKVLELSEVSFVNSCYEYQRQQFDFLSISLSYSQQCRRETRLVRLVPANKQKHKSIMSIHIVCFYCI